MCKYYHFTNYENLKSISEMGLVPRRGDRTKNIGDKRCSIFLSKGITNSILMYNSLLHHYNSFTGNNGLKAINFYKERLNYYNKRAEEIPLLEDELEEKEALISAIERINEIMTYKDFFDYIGDGVYLTVSNIIDVNTTSEKDCYTNKIIPPEKIKILILRNKITHEIIDTRESILAYFMSITPIKEIIDNINNIITIKNIKELYNNKIEAITYYNNENFELEEIPIRIYLEYKEDNYHKHHKLDSL